jgi:hypothetical protein
MELNFTEIDNLDKSSYENYNTNPTESKQPKYWEKKNNIQQKKRVSFDDILSNMNLVVNQNGVLQSMAPLQEPQYQQPQYQQPQYQQPQYQHPQSQQIQKNSDPLDPSVKHSYIFNKYFKDYKDAANDNFKPQVKVPKTIEEYKQMVFEERVRQIQERNRIAQIKSKKMFYTSNPHMQQNSNQYVIKATKNDLRSMKFG